MQALIGLAGMVIGAALAPLLDLVRQRRTDRRAWQPEPRELAAALIARSRDQLVIAKAAEEYAAATQVLRKRLLAVRSWDGEHIAAEWNAWQTATRALITATRPHLRLAQQR